MQSKRFPSGRTGPGWRADGEQSPVFRRGERRFLRFCGAKIGEVLKAFKCKGGIEIICLSYDVQSFRGCVCVCDSAVRTLRASNVAPKVYPPSMKGPSATPKAQALAAMAVPHRPPDHHTTQHRPGAEINDLLHFRSTQAWGRFQGCLGSAWEHPLEEGCRAPRDGR